MLLRLEAAQYFNTGACGGFGFIETRPGPQQLRADAQQEFMHWQLFKVLLVDQLEAFFLTLPGSLQEALSKQDFALLDKAPQRVMPDIMAARHLFGLLHHGNRLAQQTFAVQHLTVYRGGNDAAIKVRQRQLFERDRRQAFRFVLVTVVNRHLGA